ncbi:MAG TPA: SdrD B-like domain-containing protein, partial [Chitinophagales bacterium]|nr:SdrD B-like domain-containing protein [Chitinophagales bacterium]
MLVLFSTYTYAQVSGTVFRDFNSSGSKDNTATFNEIGLAGVTITAYNTLGASVGSATSSADGTYMISGVSGVLRIEFTGLQIGDYSSFAGGSSVQFVTAPATNVNFAVNYPSDYCQNNPNLATTQMVGDDYSGYLTSNAIISFSSSNVNSPAQPFVQDLVTNPNQFTNVSSMSSIAGMATQSQVGNVYGLAWHRKTKTLFSSAFGRANFMTNGGIGSGGVGAIYMTKDGVTTLFTVVNNVGTFGNADGNKVGLVGLGDLEISEDGNILYTVNVFTHQLVAIPINGTTPTAGTPTITALPVPADCPLANIHAFALEGNRNKLYIGMTCDGIGATNLTGYVYEYDGTNFVLKIQQPFNYARPNINADYYGWPEYEPYQPNNLSFADWDFYPNTADQSYLGTSPNYIYNGFAVQPKTQPWLVDIEFDRGDMLLGIRSRLGDARVYCVWVTGGDILRACADSETNPTSWTMENGGSCGGKTLYNNQITDPYTGRSLVSGFDSPIYGIGNLSYYWGNIGWEGKPSAGSLAQIPGQELLYSYGVDVISHDSEHSIMALSHQSGAIVGSGNVVYSDPFLGDLNGKGNKLGDLEILCNPAPLEIGNRIWNDTDSDGIQDAGEAGIDGVIVELYEGNTLVGTTTTANGGQWYFNNSNVNQNGASELKPNTAYIIRVLNSSFPSGKVLTSTDTDGTTNGDMRDNDASLVGGNAEIAYTTGSYGQNDHTLDMGFRSLNTPDLSLTKTVSNAIVALNG